jgi:hypothetical protein
VPASDRNDHARRAGTVTCKRQIALENKARTALKKQPAGRVKRREMSPLHDIRRRPRCEK